MISEPLISVLMPVYNAEQYLREAIESILNQTYRNFEFIIINDGSTDSSENIILSYTDSRIKYIKNERNIKLIATLNNGFAIAQGKYIARMDADDISLPERIEAQVKFMELNTHIVLAGSWFESIGDFKKIVKYETDINLIRFKLLYQTQFCHPTVIIRRDALTSLPVLFDASFIHAEDYELFSRLAFSGVVTNIPQVLVKYRVHASNVSVLYKSTQIENSQRVMMNNFAALGITANILEVSLFEKLAYQSYPELVPYLQVIENLLLKIIAASKNNKLISHPFLFNYAVQAWYNTCYNLLGTKPDIKAVFYASEIAGNYIGFWQKLRFKIKSLTT